MHDFIKAVTSEPRASRGAALGWARQPVAPDLVFVNFWHRGWARALAVLVACTCADRAHAQLGDRPNEVQERPGAELRIPPAPVLSPEQALGTFVVPPGFRVELVAAEPLVRDPVAIAFDARGRLWVAELPAYNFEMLTRLPVYLQKDRPAPPKPPGRVVILEDTDGDGRMDRRTVFLDNLDVPRAIGFWNDKVLIGDPPNLWICADTTGDGVANEKTLLAGDYVFADAKNIEAAPNGLLWGRDNWLYNASYRWRLRFTGGEWRREPVGRLGQWGITQDDFGRLYFNSNSDQLRAAVVPPHHAAKADPATPLADANLQVATDQSVWPVRPTPGVNRGYQKGFLRADGTLVAFTAASAPAIYRGTNFPARYIGNAFVPEPAAHVIKRNVIRETEGRVAAVNGYDETEFLASTDERFRPVFVSNAPDGALYLVDMYRGIIEGYEFITTYLRDQILERSLNDPLWGHGRIYRVVYSSGERLTSPDFNALPPAQLVALLDHDNGWTRDTAQRRILESGDREMLLPLLRDRLRRGVTERQRVYALWCLEGLEGFTQQDFASAIADPSVQVRLAALRAGESLLHGGEGDATLQMLAGRIESEEPIVLAQLALALDGNKSATGSKIVSGLLARAAEHPSLLDAVLFASRDRYSDLVAELSAQVRGQDLPPFGGRTLLAALSSRIAVASDESAHAALIAEVVNPHVPEWARLALMQGVVQPKMRGARPGLRSQVSSRHLADAAESAPDALVRRSAADLRDRVRNEEVRRAAQPAVAALTAEGRRLFNQGQALYAMCAPCHQPDGLGREMVAPPLKQGRWTTASSPDAAVRIVLHGKHGTPGYPGAMVPLASLDDEQIAAVLTYIRRSWGNQATEVQSGEVARVRTETANRVGAWSDEELANLRAGAH